jgi:hypothetical protein
MTGRTRRLRDAAQQGRGGNRLACGYEKTQKTRSTPRCGEKRTNILGGQRLTLPSKEKKRVQGDRKANKQESDR